MKKLLALVFALMLALSCTAAMAQEVTALASEISPETIVLKTVCVRITGYDEASGTMTVELYDNETFAEDDIMNLKAGDTIYVDGEEITVQTVEFELPGVTINMSDGEYTDDGVMLFQNNDGTFSTYIMDYPILRNMGTVTVKIPEVLLFLDGVVPETGEFLDVPVVHTAGQFRTMLKDVMDNPDQLSFDCNNVYVTFNDKAEPMIVERFYTPWQ